MVQEGDSTAQPMLQADWLPRGVWESNKASVCRQPHRRCQRIKLLTFILGDHLQPRRFFEEEQVHVPAGS